MNDERPEPQEPALPERVDRGQPDVSDLAGLVAPLAQFGVATVQDVAAVVRSTRRAGRDVWRLVNVFDRVRQVDWAGSGGPRLAAIAAPAGPAETGPAETGPADTGPAEATVSAAAAETVKPVVGAPAPRRRDAAPVANVFGPFVRVADAALRPTAALGAAVTSPVRKVVTETIGLSTDPVGDREEDLREIADRLIERSLQPNAAFVRRHPAFAQILTELTPDEARILRFLAVAGPQPSIDIRTKSPFLIGSERIAYGINMIAEMAGCGWTEFSENYLSNLNRLGLIVFSKEPVEDYRRYSLLEVQPKAVEAIEHAELPTISIYRSVYLSAFGHQFCDVCIDTDGYDAGGWAVNERGDKIVKLFGRRRKGA